MIGELGLGIMLIFLVPVVCLAEGKTSENITTRITILLAHRDATEAALASTKSTEEIALARRDLIKVLRELAVQYGYLNRETDRIAVLHELETQYEELERMGSANTSFASDIMGHVDFLCETGFGGSTELGCWQPAPDYLKALQVIDAFSNVLGQAGQERKTRIVGPVIGVSGRRTRTEGEAIVGVFVRNVEQLKVSIRGKQSGSPALVVWPVSFNTDRLFDHRTHAQTFLVTGIPKDISLSVVAEANDKVQDVADFDSIPKMYESYHLDSPLEQIESVPIKAVKSLQPALPIVPLGSKNHSMNQACSICHIPHTTSGE